MGPFLSNGPARQLVKLLSVHKKPLAGASVAFTCKKHKLRTNPLLSERLKFRTNPLLSERPKCSFVRDTQEFAYMKRSVPYDCFALKGLYIRQVSHLAPSAGNEVVLVDTLALVRTLQAQGFTSSQAEAITSVMTEVLNECLESVTQSFVARSDLEKSYMTLEAALSKLKTDVENSQEVRLRSIQHEAENLRSEIEKLRSEMRYEMEKVTAGQRLDLNLERGRMRDELAKQSTQTANLTNKLNKEINALKTQLEASKFEVIKYCIGTIVSVIALGLGLLRVFK